MREDLLSLSAQINTFGAGNVPKGELPARLQTFTPTESTESEREKKKLMDSLAPLLAQNEKLSGFCTHPDAEVELTIKPDDYSKVYRKQYPIAHALRPSIDEILDRWQKSGRIKLAPKGCRFNSPLLAVPKKDDQGRMTGVRLCLDVRAVNQYLVEDDKFQLPRIPEVLAALQGKLFGEFDLSEAYFQFHLKAESQQFTAFTWKGQQWMFVGCPFGLKHIPSLFQRFIANLFADMPFVFPYIDNLAFSSNSWEEHEEHARMIVERLTSVGLRIKPSSYNLGNTHIKLLGHVISEKGIDLDPEKKEMIMAWPKPETGAMMASALGLGAFMRDHIRNYADITAPLEALKKQTKIEWDDNLNQHWDLFKRAFATAPMLSFPDFNKRLTIAHDASQTGIGGVLYQPDDDNNVITPTNIVAICSKQLNATQRNYPVYKKELWGLVYCLRKFHSFIWGRTITAITDHKPLIHILGQRQLTVALQQWLDVILDYNLRIIHRPGVLHVLPDALSRMYTATYADPSMVWGTHSNIQLITNSESTLTTQSDALCQRSIDDIKPPSAIKKRHQFEGTKASRGGRKRSKFDSSRVTYPLTLSDDTEREAGQDEDDDNDDSITTTSVRTIHGVINRLTGASVPIQRNDATCAPAEVDADDQADLESSQYTLPLSCALELDAAHIARICERVNGTTSVYDECIDIDACCRYTSGENVPTTRHLMSLTDDEKLLIAQAKRGKQVPPVHQRASLLHHAHSAHFGEAHIQQQLDRDGHYWPGMYADIRNLVQKCRECRRYNVITHGYRPARSVRANRPGDHYQIDLCAFTKAHDGHVFCLLLVDVFTGFIILRPLKNKRAETVARTLWDIFTIIGIPKILQSDNGTEFLNEVIRTLNRLVGIESRYISEYNPRADGKVERLVRTIKLTIYKLMRGSTPYWPYHLSFVQYMYNDKVQSLTGSSPFVLMYGRQPNAPKAYDVDIENMTESDYDDWKEHQLDILSLIYPAVNARTDERQKKYRKYLDNRRAKLVAEELPIGTRVTIKDKQYLLNPQLKPTAAPKYESEVYTVSKITKHGTYVLTRSDGSTLDRGLPLDQLKICTRDTDTSEPTPTPTQTTTDSSDSDDDDASLTADNMAQSDPSELRQSQPSQLSSTTTATVKPTVASHPRSSPKTQSNVAIRILDHDLLHGTLRFKVKWKGRKASWINDQQFDDDEMKDRYFQDEANRNTRKASRFTRSAIMRLRQRRQE